MMCMPGSVGTPGEQSPGVTRPKSPLDPSCSQRRIVFGARVAMEQEAGTGASPGRGRDKVRRSVRPNPHAPSLTDRGYRNSPRSRGEASRLHHTGSTARTYTHLWPVGGSALGACIAIRCGVPSDAPIGKYTKTKAMSGCSNDSSPL